LFERLKLGVDMNPKSLKCARCRVLARLAGFDCTSHERGKLPCAANGSPAFAASDKRLCNLKSKPFFAMLTNHLLDLALIRALQKIGRCFAARGVHAHVQRRVVAKAETPFGVVDLRRAHAQVQQHALHLLDAQRGQLGGHLAEAGVADGKARVLDLRSRGNGFGVLVEGHQAACRRQHVQQGARVAAAAEGAVHVDAIRLRHQGLHGFGEQHGGV
jgi:hypothetical protein